MADADKNTKVKISYTGDSTEIGNAMIAGRVPVKGEEYEILVSRWKVKNQGDWKLVNAPAKKTVKKKPAKKTK